MRTTTRKSYYMAVEGLVLHCESTSVYKSVVTVYTQFERPCLKP